MDESQELLSDNVSQLIDAVSNLVLCTITGEMGDIKKHCESLAEYTQKVVLQAKNVAIASRNKQTTIEITKCTNGITNGIEKLIEVFIGLLQNFKDTEAKKRFAEGSKNVGMAINDLIIAADTAASRNVVESCEKAKEYQALLLKQINSAPDDILMVAREYGQACIQLSKSGHLASKYSADPAKSSMLSHAIAQVNPGMQELIKSIQVVNENPSVENKNEVAQAYKSFVRVVADVVEAANIRPDFSDSINAAFDRFNKMLDLANAVRSATDSLFNGVLQGMTDEQFAAAARAALQTTMDLIAQALKALENENDPIRREQIENSIANTKAAIAEFVKSGKAAHQDPNNAAKKQQLAKDKKNLDDNVTQLVALTSNGMEEEKLFYTAKFLEDIIAQFIEQAPTLNAEQLAYFAERIGAITERVVKDARAVAMKTNDPSKRDKILDAVNNLRKAGDRYTGDIRSLARNPGDPSLLQAVKKTHGMFADQIHLTLVAAGLEEARAAPIDVGGDSDNELIRAAKDQARLALQVVRDAERMAAQIADPQKKAQLLEAIERLKKYAQDVIHFAEIAAADPNNLDKQIQLDEAQRLLADGIRSVVLLTSSVAAELQDLMNAIVSEDDQNVAEVFALAEELMRQISSFVANIETTPPKDVVLQAKELANLTNKLSGIIRKIADDTPDPRYREQLTGLSRFMRDRATQVKMIAAVKVACGGDAGQVSSAAVGLRSTVDECVNLLKASELKRRRTRTAGRAEQIRKIIEMWQKSNHFNL